MFDIEHHSKLTGTVISKWCHTVFEHSQSLGLSLELAHEDHDPDNIRNEIFDFVKPSSGNFITFKDLCKTELTSDPVKLDVCGILCDAQCLFNHSVK